MSGTPDMKFVICDFCQAKDKYVYSSRAPDGWLFMQFVTDEDEIPAMDMCPRCFTTAIMHGLRFDVTGAEPPSK